MKKPKFFTLNYLRDLFRGRREAVRCNRCKRILKDPESIKRGYGRVCWNKIPETGRFLIELQNRDDKPRTYKNV